MPPIESPVIILSGKLESGLPSPSAKSKHLFGFPLRRSGLAGGRIAIRKYPLTSCMGPLAFASKLEGYVPEKYVEFQIRVTFTPKSTSGLEGVGGWAWGGGWKWSQGWQNRKMADMSRLVNIGRWGGYGHAWLLVCGRT